MKALREVVDSQIMEFKVQHPLQPTDICPIMNNPIGVNAEVDHVGKTFKNLTEEWLHHHPGVKPKSHPTIHSSYIIDEPYCSSWYNYHKDHATLRWLSYEGNRIAHRM
jgi:hypothetical protein